MDNEGTLGRTIQLFVGIITLIVRVFYHIAVSFVKAFLPCNVLPRKSVKNQVVLITGSGSGLGKLMAIKFGKLGAKVVLWDINEQGNLETLGLLKSKDAKAYAYTVDLSKREDIYKAAELVKQEIGDVDILINNAGVVSGKKIFDCPDELMEKTMAVNTNSLFWTAKAFVPKMLEKNHGHVVTIASLAGHVGVNGLVDYCASKHGAVGFSDALSAEIRALGKDVNVTVVNPYYINTGMFDGVKTYSNVLFPILEPEYVVERIMEAVLTNAETLYLPKAGNLHIAIKGILPRESFCIIGDHFGLNKTMNEFVGREKHNNNL